MKKLLKALAALFVSFLLVAAFSPAALADDTDVVIEAINNPELYGALAGGPTPIITPEVDSCINKGELANLSGTLDLSNKNISSIEGLEYCTKIVSLNLSGNPINKFPADMQLMTNLDSLYLSNISNLQAAANLAAIGSIPGLQYVDINHTNVTNVSFLKTIPTLTNLLWYNTSADIDLSSVAELKHLSSLEVSGDTGVHGDISALSSLTELVSLGIGSLEIRDLSPIEELGLHWLNITNNYITDLTPISGKNISTLYAGLNYLDLSDGSPDRLILDHFSAVSSDANWLQNNEQHIVAITFDLQSKGAISTMNPPYSMYFGHAYTLPAVTAKPGYYFKGWDVDGDNVPDYGGGETMTFDWPALPVPGPDQLAFTAIFDSNDAISSDPATGNPELYAALRAKYPTKVGLDHSGYITVGELESLTGSLALNGCGLKKIDGLENCQNITELDLSDNPDITNLDPLNYHVMTKLETLNLTGCENAALPAHWSMPKLTFLKITCDDALDNTNLGYVALLPKLSTLYLERCGNLDSIDAIKGMTQLQYLYIIGGSLADLPADMSGMTGLTALSLNGYYSIATGIYVPASLAALPHLHSILTIPNFGKYNDGHPALLNISYSDLKDINFLADAKGMTTLYWQSMAHMSNTKSDSISPLTATDISTIDFTKFDQLTNIDLVNDTQLGNDALQYISKLPNVRTLGIGNCGITDLSGISGLSLNTLAIGLNSITDLTPIQNMDLYSLIANNNYISDLYALSTMTHLTGLEVSQNYLDPTPGSADRVILDTVKARQNSDVHYDNEFQIIIHYTTAQGTLSKTSDTVYYQQNYTLPIVTGLPSGWALNGFATVYGYEPGGSTIPLTVSSLPIPGDEVTCQAVLETLDSSIELSGLTASPSIALSPAYNHAVTSYTLSLPASVTNVTLTPKVSASGTTFTINDESVASKNFKLACGASTSVIINVMNGSDRAQYFVKITRAAADATRLKSLGNSAGTVSPAFDPYTTSYTLTLSETTASVKLTPVKAKSTSKIYFNGVLATNKTYTLATGKSTTVSIKVVSTSGAKTTYTVVIKRKPSTNATLKSLSAGYALSPAFKANKYVYKMTVPESKSSFTVKAVKTNANAKVTIDGRSTASRKYTISNGQTKVIKIVVKAQAGNTKTYKITVTRAPHINSFKASPTVSGYPSVQLGVKPIVFTYSLAGAGGKTKLQILVAGTWKTLLDRTDGGGTKTFAWAGNIAGAPLTKGKYTVMLSSSYGGVNSAVKTMVIMVR